MNKICTITLLFITLLINAQEKANELSGFISYGLEKDGGLALDGVHVLLIYGKDTLNTTSVNGVFRFKSIKTGKAKLVAKAIGYQTVEKDLNIIAGKNPDILIDLPDESIQLNEIIIKGKLAIVIPKNDTLIYNPAAVNTQEGDVALNIVEQLPGMEIDENTVTVMGQKISTTYIDGKLIFGKDPMQALKNLLASDVLKIKVYDEYENTKTKKITFKGHLTRVLNIETRSKLSSFWNGQLLTSIGRNLDSSIDQGKFRKNISGLVNSFSEKLQITGSIFHNNIDRTSNNIREIFSNTDTGNDYTKITYANLGVEHSWETETGTYGSLKTLYTFEQEHTNMGTTSQRHYFPDNNYYQRIYEEKNKSINKRLNHDSDISFSNSNDRWGNLNWAHKLTYRNHRSRQTVYINNEEDYKITSESLMQYDNHEKEFYLLEKISYENDFSERFGYGIEGKIDIDRGKVHSARIDTLQSSLTQTYLIIPSEIHNTQWEGNIQLLYLLPPKSDNQLYFNYAIKHENGGKHQSAWNMLNPIFPQVDEANTYNYKVNNLIQSLNISASFHLNNHINCEISAGFKESTLKREEEQKDNYRKVFISPMTKISFTNISITKSWSALYQLSNITPNIVQLRPQVDNSNPYILRSGNSKLKQTYTHMLSFSYNNMLGKYNHTLGATLNASIHQHSFTSRTIYYDTETYLSDLQYTVPAHGSLVCFENIEGYWNIKGSLVWQAPIQRIKSKYSLFAGFEYEHNPYYVGEDKTITRTYDPSLRHLLLCNLTKNMKITISANTRFIHSFNSRSYTGKTFYQAAGVQLSINQICNYLYFNSDYNFIFSHDYGFNKETNRNHSLKLSIGCKVFKRQGDISFTVYDLLNSHRTFNSKMFSNYIQNTWTNYYGRFIIANFTYRFGKTK